MLMLMMKTISNYDCHHQVHYLLLKRWFSKLPRVMNSYTRRSSLSSQQYPNSFTRFGWESLPKKLTSDCKTKQQHKQIMQMKLIIDGLNITNYAALHLRKSKLTRVMELRENNGKYRSYEWGTMLLIIS